MSDHPYKKGYEYVNCRDHTVLTPIIDDRPINHPLFSLSKGVFIIRKNYAWNGASGPTFDTPSTIIPCMEHDCFFQCFQEGWLDKRWIPEVNAFMEERLVDCGMWSLRAGIWYYGVQFGGDKAAATPNPVLYAPNGLPLSYA